MRLNQSEVEKSDHFEDCESKVEITPILHTIVTILTYEQPPDHCFEPPVHILITGHKRVCLTDRIDLGNH